MLVLIVSAYGCMYLPLRLQNLNPVLKIRSSTNSQQNHILYSQILSLPYDNEHSYCE